MKLYIINFIKHYKVYTVNVNDNVNVNANVNVSATFKKFSTYPFYVKTWKTPWKKYKKNQNKGLH